MGSVTGYYGTYSSPNSRGIYRFFLDTDTGELTGPELVQQAPDAKCLAWAGTALAAPFQEGERAGLMLLDPQGQILSRRLIEHRTSCYLLADEQYVYAANYHEGTVSVCARESLAPRFRIEAGTEAGCHQVLLWKGLVLVPCLELDEVRIYDPARGFAQVDALTFPAGTGPRHGVLDRAGERLFLVSERSNQLFLFGAEGRRFIPAAAYPVAEHGASAAIRLSRDERFVYLSTRESDVLTVFQTEGLTARRAQQVPCGGLHPRDFDLTADGRWLLCLNRDSGELVSFPADPGTGLLGPRCASLRAPRGSGILLNAN